MAGVLVSLVLVLVLAALNGSVVSTLVGLRTLLAVAAVRVLSSVLVLMLVLVLVGMVVGTLRCVGGRMKMLTVSMVVMMSDLAFSSRGLTQTVE